MVAAAGRQELLHHNLIRLIAVLGDFFEHHFPLHPESVVSQRRLQHQIEQ